MYRCAQLGIGPPPPFLLHHPLQYGADQLAHSFALAHDDAYRLDQVPHLAVVKRVYLVGGHWSVHDLEVVLANGLEVLGFEEQESGKLWEGFRVKHVQEVLGCEVHRDQFQESVLGQLTYQ